MVFSKKKEQQRFEAEQRARGLVEHKGKWGTPKQVEEWKETDRVKTEQMTSTKKFVRSWASPIVQQSRPVREEVKLVSCPYCQAKFDLMKSPKCFNCGAPYKG